MADMMAIVSKAIFEKVAGKAPSAGTKLKMDRYVSANKALEPLSGGGKLYLVTVRPPDEALWLVAILEKPKHDGDQWIAKASQIPITDISKLRSKIKFESGVGITAKKGALGMSLQTPRALTSADTTLLDKAAGLLEIAAEPEDKGIPAPPSSPSPIGAATGERRGSILDAILDNPDSDEARQVYADQLIANNDPRGEFILLDIALAGPLSIRKREQLAARRAQLLKDHAKAWWPYSVAQTRVHKGFLQAVHGSWKQINAIAAQLFAAEPVTEVNVSVGGKDLGALLKASWLPRIHRLILRGIDGDEGFTMLAASPQLANLRALNVTGNEIGSDAFAGLENGDALPRLENLCLTANPIGDEGIAGLAQWKQLANLDTLYLSSCELSEDGLDQLFAENPLAKLTTLTLSNNEIGDSGAGVLAKCAARMPALEHLELANCGLSASGAKALAKAKLPKLKRLDLRRNDLDEKLAAADPRMRV
jgi:uncharacterized protein (TIGR02996 family)